MLANLPQGLSLVLLSAVLAAAAVSNAATLDARSCSSAAMFDGRVGAWSVPLCVKKGYLRVFYEITSPVLG